MFSSFVLTYLTCSLQRLIEHLLKLNYWEAEYDRFQRGWKLETIEFRTRIKNILEDSPSLKNYVTEIYPRTHKLAIARMSIIFDLPENAAISQTFALSDKFFE